MAPLMDGRILIYGGYSREKVKKDVDKGIAYTDMYYLQVDGKFHFKISYQQLFSPL